MSTMMTALSPPVKPRNSSLRSRLKMTSCAFVPTVRMNDASTPTTADTTTHSTETSSFDQMSCPVVTGSVNMR